MNPRKLRPPESGGFSLTELLIVVAITVTLMSLLVPSVGQFVVSHRLTQAGQMVVDEINNARALATARNQPVEVWFLCTSGETEGGWVYRTIGSRLLEASRDMPWVTRSRRLPEPMVISPSEARSNCIGGQTPQDVEGVPGLSKGVAIRIHPNGRMEAVNPKGNLKLGDPLFLTIGAQAEVGDAGNSLPRNFVTVQIEPRNGRVTSFRP
jgi:uncharacterized protein (TIGR02596 family)